MSRIPTWRLVATALTFGWCVVAIGCASWRGPRIDPSGDRFFIWPGETPAPVLVGPPVAGPVVAPPPGVVPPPVIAPPGAFVSPPPAAPIIVAPPTSFSQPFGNVLAPPVYSDPHGAPVVSAPPIMTTPGVAVPGAPTPVVPMPTAPPPPVAPPGTVTPMGVVVPVGQDQLRVAPERIIAPVASEVVLKAAVCGADGYLVANQPVDWSIDRSGPGQIGNLSGDGTGSLFSWWQEPRRVDPWTAIGTTAREEVRLYRGTPDPRDDVQILRGDTWVTVTSGSEGTSAVHACAPSINGMNRATAVIHWVDADWVFPPASVCVEAGRPHVLTTTMLRRTSGAPLAGWIVRYQVLQGASLGYGGGSSVDVSTDANGRASVEVSPNDAGGGTATIFMSIVSPGLPGGAESGLELSRTSSVITWQVGAPSMPAVAPALDGAAPALPPDTSPGMAPPPTFATPPADAAPLSPTPSPPTPYTAPPAAAGSTPPVPTSEAPPTPAGRPLLELQVRRIGAEQVAVGEYVSFDVTITNRGDGVARGILVTDRFDRGLRHPKAEAGVYGVEYAVRDLDPNDSETAKLTFQVVDAGRQCHEVTVTAEGVARLSSRECITAQAAALEVNLTGPRRQIVGESAAFSAVVRNVGDVAATNVEIVFQCDPAITPTLSESDARGLPDGGVLIRIAKLEAGERRPIRMEGRCNAANNRACTRVHVNADGGATASAEACVEILPPLDSLGAGAVPGAPGAASTGASNLRLTITETKNPARLREQQTLFVTIENTGQQAETKVAVRVFVPQELTLDASQIQPQSEATVLGQEIRFTAIPELRAGEQRRYVIPVTPNRAGQVQVRGQAASTRLTTPMTVDSNTIEILP